MNRLKSFLLFFALVFTFSGTVSAETVDRIVAVVNKEPITQYDVEKVMQNLNNMIQPKQGNSKKKTKNSPQLPNEQELRQQALDYLIGQALVRQEMKKKGTQVTDADVEKAIQGVVKRNNMTLDGLKKELVQQGTSIEQYREGIRKQLEQYNFLGQFGSKVRVTEEEVNDFYAQNADQMGSVQEVRFAQILIPVNSEAEMKEASSKAKEVYQRAKKGEDFNQLIEKYGGPGSGDLGKVNFSSLSPQLAPALQRIETGEITEPIRTSVGFVIIKMIEKPKVNLAGQEPLKEKIRERIYDVKLQEELRKQIEQLKNKAYINVL